MNSDQQNRQTAIEYGTAEGGKKSQPPIGNLPAPMSPATRETRTAAAARIETKRKAPSGNGLTWRAGSIPFQPIVTAIWACAWACRGGMCCQAASGRRWAKASAGVLLGRGLLSFLCFFFPFCTLRKWMLLKIENMDVHILLDMVVHHRRILCFARTK